MKISHHKFITNTLLLIVFVLLVFPNYLFGQESRRERLNRMHREVLHDPYIPVKRDTMPRSKAYRVDTSFYFTRQVNVDENGDNIVGDASNEPSIAIDPTNPNRIIIGWRHFNTIESNFRQAGYGYSNDGGQTWHFPDVLTPGVFRSDPVLDFDKNGNFYYNSLKETFECDVFKIDDGEFVFGEPVPAKGGDKQWMKIDRTEGLSAGYNYSFWNQYYSSCNDNNFTRSTDNSMSFEACSQVPEDPVWGTLAVDADGNLYAVGEGNNGITVLKSSSASNPLQSVSWEQTTIVDLDGHLSGFTQVNPQGLLGQAWIDVDVSNGPGHNNVYVLASVNRISAFDEGDVMFAKSTDGGKTFEPPIRINTDTSNKIQWFGTMSVAPNGRIDVVWLDTRDTPNFTFYSKLYYSFSIDQGETWSENQPISIAFDPSIGYPQQGKMGDYFHMISDNEGAHLAWANTINGGQDVYYTRIIPKDNIGTNSLQANKPVKINLYPNPFNDKVTCNIHSENRKPFVLKIYNPMGACLKHIKVYTGETTLKLAELNTGIYYYSLSDLQNHVLRTGKLIKIK